MKTPNNFPLFYKIGSQRTLQLRMAFLTIIKFTNHPSHVASKRPHGLHTFIILGNLTRCLTIGHVPILRTDMDFR